MSQSKTTTTKKKSTRKKAARKKGPEELPSREYVQAPLVHDPGVACPHCDAKYDHKKAHKYPNGRQRMICGGCALPFVVWRERM